MAREELVTLVTTEIFTPYRAGEVFSVSKEMADKLLRQNMERTDFGPRYPKVKVRLFKPGADDQLLLDNGVLNQVESLALLKEISPELYEDRLAAEGLAGGDDAEDEPATELDAVKAAPVRRRSTR